MKKGGGHQVWRLGGVNCRVQADKAAVGLYGGMGLSIRRVEAGEAYLTFFPRMPVATCTLFFSSKCPSMLSHPQSTLEQLDLDQFSSQVTKYSKYVNQLEKGLPRNNVVPSLKDKVELMKQRVSGTKCPVVTDVCVNNCRSLLANC